MSLLFLLVSLWGAWFTYNAYRPIYAPGRRAVVSFFAGWPTSELALHHIAWQAVATAFFLWMGALGSWPGQVGLVITLASWVGLAECFRRHHRAEEIVERALRDGLGAAYADRIRPELRSKLSASIDWRRVVFPFPLKHRDVERVRDIRYCRVAGLDLQLDVYRHRSHPANCPTLLQIHGGAWVIGSKNEQGLPLMLQMASQGWVCVSVDYRLSPHATFPEHLIDVKRALSWIRERGAEFGADPDFVVVTGGSAGGHLASLVALTANDPEYQPGFENADTSVQGCVPFYGVYDFTNRFGHLRHDGLAELLEKQVMKASPEEAPEAYDRASPMSRIHADAPPFLIVHGDRDSLAPVEDARRFAESLRRTSKAEVVYAEIPNAQHAFELFPSLRSLLVINGVARFASYLYSRYLEALESDAAPRLAATGTGDSRPRAG